MMITTQGQYRDWMSGLIASHHQASGLSPAEFNTQCLFFVTVTFNQQTIAALRAEKNIHDCRLEINAGAFLYRLACELFDLRTGLKGRRERPVAIIAVDHNDSRLSGFKAAAPRNLHLHSLWIAKHDEALTYLKVLQSLRLQEVLRQYAVNSVHARPFEKDKAVANALDYIFKAWHKSQLAPNGWLDILPITVGLNDPLPKLRQGTNSPRKAMNARLAPDERYRKKIESEPKLFAWDDVSDSDDPVLADAA